MTAVLDRLPRPGQPGYARIDFGRFIDDHLAIPDRVRTAWSELARSVVDHDRVEQLHAAREEYREVVREWVAQLEDFVAFCHRVAGGTGAAAPVVAQAEAGLASLRDFEANLFERWQTLDDLGDLVLAEARPLTSAELSALARKYPPPQSWYDEPQGEKPW